MADKTAKCRFCKGDIYSKDGGRTWQHLHLQGSGGAQEHVKKFPDNEAKP